MQTKLYDLIVSYVNTEKSVKQRETLLKYAFIVQNSATKVRVKSAVEKIFGVGVKKVNVLNLPGKVKIFKNRRGRRPGYKKAVVTLLQGQEIPSLV